MIGKKELRVYSFENIDSINNPEGLYSWVSEKVSYRAWVITIKKNETVAVLESKPEKSTTWQRIMNIGKWNTLKTHLKLNRIHKITVES